MSFEDDLKKLGDDVADLVDSAVNSHNFQQLNRKISNSINQFIYPRKDDKNFSAPPENGPYQQQERRYRRPDSYASGSEENTWQQNQRSAPRRFYGQRTDTASYEQNQTGSRPYQWRPPSRMMRRHLFMSTADVAFLGGFQTTIGVILTVLFGLPLLSIPFGLWSGAYISFSGLLFSFLLCLLPTAAGGYLIYRGKTNRRLCRHFRMSQNFIGPRDYITISELSQRLRLSHEDTLDEVHRMLEKRMFRQGHLDRQETCLMITDDMYRQYLQLEKEQARKQQEAIEKEQEMASKGLSQEYLDMLRECETYLSNIHQCAADLSGAAIAEKIRRLELIVSRILEAVKKHPEKAANLQKFMDYYMPTTWKLLDAYRSFEKEPIQSDNIRKTKTEIEETLDTINNAFETLLNDLFQSTAWDIASDISVLETMLAQEGLTGNKMKF